MNVCVVMSLPKLSISVWAEVYCHSATCWSRHRTLMATSSRTKRCLRVQVLSREKSSRSLGICRFGQKRWQFTFFRSACVTQLPLLAFSFFKFLFYTKRFHKVETPCRWALCLWIFCVYYLNAAFANVCEKTISCQKFSSRCKSKKFVL